MAKKSSSKPKTAAVSKTVNQRKGKAKGVNKTNANDVLSDSSTGGENADFGKGITEKAMKNLISEGKKQGYLSYDDLNKALPDDMLAADQIDETLIMFGELGIDIIDEHNKKITKRKNPTDSAAKPSDDDGLTDYGSVTVTSDIAYPPRTNLFDLFAGYYNAVPDGASFFWL